MENTSLALVWTGTSSILISGLDHIQMPYSNATAETAPLLVSWCACSYSANFQHRRLGNFPWEDIIFVIIGQINQLPHFRQQC